MDSDILIVWMDSDTVLIDSDSIVWKAFRGIQKTSFRGQNSEEDDPRLNHNRLRICAFGEDLMYRRRNESTINHHAHEDGHGNSWIQRRTTRNREV
jgi:hypothetical protein